MKLTVTRWIPSDPLPARIADQLRPLLAGAADVEGMLAALGRAWQQYRVDRQMYAEVLSRAERRDYLRRMAAPAAELVRAIGEIPQEVLGELHVLLDDEYPTATRLLDDLERVQHVLILLRVAVGRMEPLAAGRVAAPAELRLARGVAATLGRAGIECAARREGTFERVLTVLVGKDAHRLAQKVMLD